MQTVRASLIVSLLLIFALCTNSLAERVGRIESMKLLAPGVGWAATSQKLFWTSDNGQNWSDVTPKIDGRAHIESVFFINESTGWVLLASERAQLTETRLDLASTNNSGASWSIARIKVPDLDPESTTLTGRGVLDFADSLHGWLNLDVASSANFQLGSLLMTDDGGKSWKWAPESPGVFGSIRFATLQDGWLAGGPGHEKLYATHDGSKSWQEVSIIPPKEAGSASFSTYDSPPIFEDEKHGFLPVTFSAPGSASSTLVLFATNDGGRAWKPDRVLSNLKEASPGQTFPSTVADSVWIMASVSKNLPSLTTVSPGAAARGNNIDVSVPDSPFFQLSFAHSNQGWVLTNGRLQSTTDGGATWKEVTPPTARVPRLVSEPIKAR